MPAVISEAASAWGAMPWNCAASVHASMGFIPCWRMNAYVLVGVFMAFPLKSSVYKTISGFPTNGRMVLQISLDGFNLFVFVFAVV